MNRVAPAPAASPPELVRAPRDDWEALAAAALQARGIEAGLRVAADFAADRPCGHPDARRAAAYAGDALLALPDLALRLRGALAAIARLHDGAARLARRPEGGAFVEIEE